MLATTLIAVASLRRNRWGLLIVGRR